MLERQEVPPIPNLEEPDEEAKDLRFSRGGHFDVEYALHFAAGFGSQVGLAAWRRGPDPAARIDADLHSAWLQSMAGPKQSPEPT